MNWLEKLGRNVGLMIHHIKHPDGTTKRVSKTVEEKQIDESVTLRRTTIEEIEVRKKP